MPAAARLFPALAHRLAINAGVVLGVAFLAFGIPRWTKPETFVGDTGLGAVLQAMERAFVHFDFGVASGWPGHPTVHTMWARGFAADVWMLLGTIAIGVGGGVALGFWCAARRGTRRARVVETLAVVLYCAPVYVVGLGLLLLFHPDFGRWPLPMFFNASPVPVAPFTAPWTTFRALLVPWLVAAAPVAAMCLRLVLSLVREEMEADYVRTASAKGLPHGLVVRRHAGPHANLGTASLVGVTAPLIVTNLILVERVFGVPGFFLHTWRAAGHLPPERICRGCRIPDYAMLAGITVWAAVFVVVLGVAADYAVTRIDPRIRAGRSAGG